MESGGGGVPETGNPLERMPSSAESESAFSTATEAESEMTDAADFEEGQSITPRQTYFLSYATDCLSAYDLVKKRSLAGIRALDDLCVMIKARVGLEETYAKGLEKVANQAFRDGLDSGSFREGLEGLRSDLVNKAVQHRALAKNISSDVVEPLAELRGQLNSKMKALVARAAKLQRDTRFVDEKYRRSYSKYHRCHREAALSLSAAVEGGAVPPPEPRPHRRLSLERSSTNPESSRPTTTADAVAATATAAGGTPPTGRVSSPPPPPAAPALRRRAMSATLDKVREAMPSASNKKDLVQWFLPSEKNRKESLIEAAQAAADGAEEARKNCLACWVALRSSIYGAIQEFQRVLTDFQGCEEQLVSEAQDGMRKHVVFESSSLANQQYDLQMLFKVMETVNVEMDLRNFIRQARREVASDVAVAAQAAAAAANEEAAAAATPPAAAAAPAPAKGSASPPGSAAASPATGEATEAGAGAALANGANGPVTVTAVAASGGAAGAGVLSTRADRRGTALAFERLFGVGPDLPPPPTEEEWVPPEVEGEAPAASRQALVELFHVPLMTKEDISKYLDATDPVAGAAASEAAATAIKALGAPTLAGGAGGAAAKDARVDAALASLSSHYPVVTPAASVYEVLGFAAQARHAKNYADLLAGASDAAGGSGSGTASASASEKGDGEASAAGAAAETAAVAPPPPVPAAANSSDGSSTSSSAVVGAPSAVAKEKQTTAASSPDGGGGGNGKAGSRGEGSEGIVGGFGGVASAFAAAAAAFTAADSSNPPAAEQVVSRSVFPVPTPAEAAAPSTEGAGAGVEAGAVHVGGADRSGGASAGEQPPVTPTAAVATVAAEAKTTPESQSSSGGSSTGHNKSGIDGDSTTTTTTNNNHNSTITTTTAAAAAKLPASPCLALATERPFVFAATLADDVLESLHAEGAGATGRRGSELDVGISGEGEGEEEEEEEAGAEAAGERSGGEGAPGDERDPAAVVARAVEALLMGGGAGSLDAREVDAAAKACGDSPSSSNRLLLALCQNACASCGGSDQDPSAAEPTASTAGGSSRGGFSPVRVPPASFAALATLLRASLNQAAADREFLQARNCLLTAALYAVDGAEYVSWLREQSGGGGGSAESLSSAVMADSELVSAAGRLDEAAAATGGVPSGEGVGEVSPGAAGGQTAGVDYLLLRELRRHSVWATIELWEVSMSDSVVMAMEGGGARAERWLPGSVVTGLNERFGEDAAGRQLDVKLGQLAFFGHSMLACGLPPSEVRSLLRKCSSLAMEIPPPDLEALMAALNSFVMGPRPDRAHPRSRSVSSTGGGQEAAPGGAGGGGPPAEVPVEGEVSTVGGGGGGGDSGSDDDDGSGSSGSGGDSGSSEESESESYTSESGLSRDEGAP